MPILEEGLEQAEQTAEEIKKSRGKYHRVQQLPIKDGDEYFLRFLTDRTLSGLVHQFMPTKPQPEEFTGSKWPSMMWGLCQNDKMYRLRDGAAILDEFEDGYGDCWICSNYKGMKDEKYGHDKSRPTHLIFGLAVVRVPEEDPKTKRVRGFTDELVEHTVKTGEGKDAKSEIVQVPRIVVVAQRYEPLWHPVKATAFTEPYTYLDKDFAVARKGKQDKDWKVAPVNFTSGRHEPGTPSWGVYGQALELLDFSLPDWFLSHGTYDHYARWFIPGAVPEGGYGRDGDEHEAEAEDAGTAAATTGSAGVDASELDKFRDSMRRGNK